MIKLHECLDFDALVSSVSEMNGCDLPVLILINQRLTLSVLAFCVGDRQTQPMHIFLQLYSFLHKLIVEH